MKKLIISGYEPLGVCDVSEQESVEVLIVSSEDKTIDQARMSFKEFRKLVKFRAKQENRNGPAPAAPPPPSPAK